MPEINFLQRNIAVTAVILVVLLARFFLRKQPKKYSFVLWAFVAARMFFDVTIPGIRFSLSRLLRLFWGRTEEMSRYAMPAVSLPAADIVSTGNVTDGLLTAVQQSTAAEGGKLPEVTDILCIVWLAGLLLFLCYGVVSYLKCKGRLKQAVRLQDNVWECDRVASPFVFGIFFPRIYIPFHLGEEEKKYILAHENFHIRRRDYLIKLFAFLLLAIYWVNPFVWLAFHLMTRDMEMSCDEAVLEQFGGESKKSYSICLLKFAKERTGYVFAPLAFGEADARKRIKNILGFKKPKLWAAAGIVILTAGLGIFCLSNAGEASGKREQGQISDRSGQEQISGKSEQETESDGSTGRSLTVTELVRLLDGGELAGYDYKSCSNARRDELGDSLTYLLSFDLAFADRSFLADVYYWKETEELDSVVLCDKDTNEICWLYGDGEIKKSVDELEAFLTTQKSLEDELMSIALPEGCEPGSYDAALVYNGGALIGGPAYELYSEEIHAPEYWYYTGFFAVLYGEGWGLYSWKKDSIVPMEYTGENHTSARFVRDLHSLAFPGYLLQVSHDLYTAPDLEELEQKGLDLQNIETTSDYWYIIMGDKDSNKGYCLALTAKLFSEEEAVKIAESMVVKAN